MWYRPPRATWDGWCDVSGKLNVGAPGCQIFGATETGVAVCACGKTPAAVRAECSSRHAAARQRKTTRRPPMPARPIESVRPIFWSCARLRRPCALGCLVVCLYGAANSFFQLPTKGNGGDGDFFRAIYRGSFLAAIVPGSVRPCARPLARAMKSNRVFLIQSVDRENASVTTRRHKNVPG